jgi:hypothetical protein
MLLNASKKTQNSEFFVSHLTTIAMFLEKSKESASLFISEAATLLAKLLASEDHQLVQLVGRLLESYSTEGRYFHTFHRISSLELFETEVILNDRNGCAYCVCFSQHSLSERQKTKDSLFNSTPQIAQQTKPQVPILSHTHTHTHTHTHNYTH